MVLVCTHTEGIERNWQRFKRLMSKMNTMQTFLKSVTVAWVLVFAMAGGTPAFAKAAPESFADLAEKLLPAVVNISTTQVIESRTPQQMPQFPPGSPFEDFFKDFFDKNQQGNGQPRQRKATSLGSGFIIDYRANGDTYVVTNNHVVQDADEVYVILHDDTRMQADIVGRDNKTDLAVLKVHADRELPSVPLGNSSNSRVGDWVVAIGNPFGLGGTVTAGIISARGRDINAGPYDDFIQTDASINRGNSGGPMFNMDGEVIGINTAIFSPSGGSVGIGFAIPTSTATPVIKQLIDHGKVQRGWLGVHIQVVTDSIAETLGLDKAEGALVASVIEDGPAAKAGIKARDVILEFDGKKVSEMRQLPRIVAATDVGRKVSVKVWRDGALASLKVTLGKLDEEEQVASAEAAPGSQGESSSLDVNGLGLSVAPASSAVREKFGLEGDVEGVVITDVDVDGPAYSEGLRPGDILAEVNQEQVSTPDDVERQVASAQKADKKSVLLLVETQAGPRFVAVQLR